MSVPAASHSALHVHSAAAAHWAGQNEPSGRVSCWLGGGAPTSAKWWEDNLCLEKASLQASSFMVGLFVEIHLLLLGAFLRQKARKETSRETLFVLDSLSPKEMRSYAKAPSFKIKVILINS